MMIPHKLILLAISLTLASATTTPRGVSPEDARLYAPSDSSQTFTCITNPSIRLPLSRVNDDFCDCPDGSDEPGTSACAGLPHSNISIPGFYCRNIGHTPAFLPLSRVNDGVCDYDICCDGSDEYAGVGGVRCPSKCKEIGAAARKMAAERSARRSKASKARAELVRKASVMKKEIEDNIATTGIKIQVLEVKVVELRQKLVETEERERRKVAAQKTEHVEKAEKAVAAVKERVGELKTLLEKLKEQRDAAEARLEKTEAILSTLKVDYNPNFNDEGVKRAVRAWEEYLADSQTGDVRNAAEERDLGEVIEADDIDWDELAVPVEQLSGGFQLTQYLPLTARNWVDGKLHQAKEFLISNGLLAAPAGFGSEPAAVTAARNALMAAEAEVTNTKRHLTSLESDLSADFGPSDVFRSLKGTCISREFGEYKYEVCFLDKAYQISRKDSGRTSLGGFSSIEIADDESSHNEAAVFAGRSWEESHMEPLSSVTLKYTNGQQCWNGPKRSVSAQLYCSAENEIRTVVEAEKCVYHFEVGTPAVCDEAIEKGKVRDEL